MARGLDHIVHAVRDLDAAAGFYRRLGFTVSARNIHPWGTHNHVVQLNGFFVEILGIGDADLLAREAERGGMAKAFGAFNREFLARGEGFSTLIVEAKSIDQDVAALAAAGIGASDALQFSRVATMPNGSQATVGFTLGFAHDEMSPQTAFAVMQQANPKLFWNAALQSHANGAGDVAGVVLVADNPADHHVFLTAFSGQRSLRSTSMGIAAETPRGDIEIIEPISFRDRFGIEQTTSGEGATLAGLRIMVPDIGALQVALSTAGIASDRQFGALVVGPQAALGATLIFEPATRT